MLEEQIALELQMRQATRFVRFSLRVANQNIEQMKKQLVRLYRLNEELLAEEARRATGQAAADAAAGPAPS